VAAYASHQARWTVQRLNEVAREVRAKSRSQVARGIASKATGSPTRGQSGSVSAGALAVWGVVTWARG